jgi:hypothetical protein
MWASKTDLPSITREQLLFDQSRQLPRLRCSTADPDQRIVVGFSRLEFDAK